MSDPTRQLKNNLTRQLVELKILAATQRGLRLGLRAAWLGIGGFLMGWALQQLGDWLPDRRSWLILGLLFALFPLFELLLYWWRRKSWVYRLDHRMEQRGQVSTAWEQSQKEAPGLMAGALMADVIRDLPEIQQRVERRGWSLEKDLVSAAVVLLLAILVGASALIQTFPAGSAEAAFEEIPLAVVPTLQPEPRAAQVFPQGPLGLGPMQGDRQNQGLGEGGSGEGEQGAPGGAQSEGRPGDASGPGQLDSTALEDALQELGEALNGQAGTHDLGEALQDLELGDAAEELEDLADQLESLSGETRQNLSEALDDAAQDIEGAGAQDLAQDLEDTSEALESQDESSREQAKRGLDRAADDLRDLAQQLGGQQAAGGGTGDGGADGQTGSVETHERLQGEGGDLDLLVDDPSDSGLLSPARPGEAGDGTASGSLDGTSPAGEAGGNPLIPNTFLWKWRDVVGQYFKR